MSNSVQKALMAAFALITLGSVSAQAFAEVTPTPSAPVTAATTAPASNPAPLKAAQIKGEGMRKARTLRVKELRKARRLDAHARRLHAKARLDRKSARELHKKLSEANRADLKK